MLLSISPDGIRKKQAWEYVDAVMAPCQEKGNNYHDQAEEYQFFVNAVLHKQEYHKNITCMTRGIDTELIFWKTFEDWLRAIEHRRVTEWGEDNKYATDEVKAPYH